VVSVSIPNSKIKDWDTKREEYLRIKKWKEDELNPLIEEVKRERKEKYLELVSKAVQRNKKDPV
jgi:hypothetical protein